MTVFMLVSITHEPERIQENDKQMKINEMQNRKDSEATSPINSTALEMSQSIKVSLQLWYLGE